MDFKSYELDNYPNHYTSVNATILASIGGVAYYVDDKGYKYTYINGMIITIVQGNGDSAPMREKLC